MLDSPVDSPFHHSAANQEQPNGGVIGWVGFVLYFMDRTYLDNYPYCQVHASFVAVMGQGPTALLLILSLYQSQILS